MAIRTIFTMVEDCSLGSRIGWHEFIRGYGGIAHDLLKHYFPTLAPELDSHVAAVFKRAREDDNGWFRRLHFTNEREFLMAYRSLVFDYARGAARIPTPGLSLEQMGVLMRDLSLIQREFLWVFLKGYGSQQAASMMMNAAATAEDVQKIANQRLAAILPGATYDALNIAARVLIKAAEDASTEQCLSFKIFNNLVNGQISWRDRELAEEHIRDCFFCLDRFTSFQEMIWCRKRAQLLPDISVEQIAETLNLPSRKGALARLLK